MNTYSHSRLSTFEQCRLKYKYQYIDHLETEIKTTVEAFMGDLVHQTLEKLYQDVKFQKLPTLQELLHFYNDLWKKNWNESIIVVREEYSPENYRKMGEQFITDYYHSYKPFNQTKTIALETMRTVEIAPGIRFHIRIDRLALADPNTYEIHDYKTSQSLPTQQEVEKDRQLAIYAYGLKQMYPDAERIRLIWHYLAFNKELVVEKTDEELEYVKEQALETIKEIKQCDKFPPAESSLCRWCQFQPVCPLWKHHVETKEKKPKEYLSDNGVTLVNKLSELTERINNLEAEKENIRDALIAFAKKNNVEMVYGSDVRASVRTYPKLSFPKKDDPLREEFFRTLKTIGLWDTLAIADVYELAKMINRKELHKDMLNLLDKFIEKSEITRVSLRKKRRF